MAATSGGGGSARVFQALRDRTPGAFQMCCVSSVQASLCCSGSSIILFLTDAGHPPIHVITVGGSRLTVQCAALGRLVWQLEQAGLVVASTL